MGKVLRDLKKRIKIVSPNEKKNLQIYELIQLDNDCFGVDCSEEYEQCRTCNILAEFEDKRGPLYEFCKEFMVRGGEEEVGKVPEEEKVEEQDQEKEDEMKKKEKSKPKKEEKKMEAEEGKTKIKKVSGLKLAKELFADGKTEEQVISQLVKRYVEQGRDKDFAEKRAKLYVDLAKK